MTLSVSFRENALNQVESRYNHITNPNQLWDLFRQTEMYGTLRTEANENPEAIIANRDACQYYADHLRRKIQEPTTTRESALRWINEAALLDRLAEVLPATAPTPVRARPVADIGIPAHTA